MATLRVAIIDEVVEIGSNDIEIVAQLDRALHDVRRSSADPTARFMIDAIDEHRARLTGPTPWEGEFRRRDALSRAITALNRFVLDHIPDLCVHAATICQDHGVHALTAASGVGKTTLLSSLMSLGEAAGNDELLRLRPDGSAAPTWPKPLSVKPWGSEAAADPFEREPFVSLPISESGRYRPESGPVRSIVVLRRDEVRSEPAAHDLSAADAMVQLGNRVMNFRRVGTDESLRALAAAVAGAATWVVDVGEPDTTARFVREQLSGRTPHPVPWEMLTVHDEPVADGCRTIVLGDASVVWSPTTERLTALDPNATRLWLDTARGNDVGVLAHRGFVQQLESLGLLDLGERTRASNPRPS